MNVVYPEPSDDPREAIFDLEKALDRIVKGIEKNEKILIYGDYDADGITSSVVMYEALEMAGAKNIEVMIPDRFKDGYGMGERLVKYAFDKQIDLVVTVDCGSNNAEIIDQLKKIGVETVVTDHHECTSRLPEAVAIVNPKRKDVECNPIYQYFSGVGVAFMVARGLVKRGKIRSGQEKWLLDMVAIGTICDSMYLLEMNRSFCFFGMKVIEKTRRVGLKELLRVSGTKKINAEVIGFLLGPRINATGRMKSAETAFKLLTTKSKIEAISLVQKMEELNNLRKKEQNTAVDEIEKRGVGDDSVVVEYGKWHEGVLGIIAGRLTEMYRRPSFVLSEVEEGVLKGSGRSFGEFNLALALSECQNVIIGGGGHAGACGVKVLVDRVEDFKKRLNYYYESLKLEDQERFLECIEDLEVDDFGEIDMKLMEKIKKLEPFGMGNLEPVFKLRNVFVLDSQKMGEEGKHLKLTVRDGEGRRMKLVAFYAKEKWLNIKGGDRLNVWASLVENEWNGVKSVEGRILRMEGVSI